MAPEPRSERWLFLEQEGDVSEWTDAGQRERRKVFSILPDGNWEWMGAEKDIISAPGRILLLFARHEANLASTQLPKGLAAELAGTSTWRVWCHYGGNVELSGESGPESLWKSWRGLDGPFKNAIFEANGRRPPAPYSKAQLSLPWSSEILRVKRLIRNPAAEGERRRRWRQIIQLLERAWEKVDPATAFDGLLRTLTRTLPAVLAARLVREAINSEPEDPCAAASRALELYRSSGLPDQAPAFPPGTADKRVADLEQRYDDLRHAMVLLGWWQRGTTSHLEMRASPDGIRRALWRLRKRLEHFEEAHHSLSESATARLRTLSPPGQSR